MKSIIAAVISIATPLLLTGCSSPQSFPADADERSMSETRFELLTSLAGEWYLVGGERLGEPVEPRPDEPFMTYSVSSGGNSVIEKLFVGKPNEMISIYYLDMGRLNLDHYCSLGNQPRMVAAPGTESMISFELVAVSDMPDPNDLHISSHALELNGPEDMTAYWGATKDEKPSLGSRYNVRRMTQP